MSKKNTDIQKFLEMQCLFQSSSKSDIETAFSDISGEEKEDSTSITNDDVKYFVLLEDILSDEISTQESIFGKYKN